ncbi:hypothetical protein G5C51_08170 [Streptomyces sp. A7024]|uniref:Uncharacterized protein n=1 Tax=Streptomyces coryli TaxID=1128680 RepID=A0A6G4TVT2_9ACTN|nr:hypothetical protein [Streptomyces coryli]NGN63882.1 hypothetical protein [Streptomyces coryli]
MTIPDRDWGPRTLALVDHEHDRDAADDGRSRYGAYLRVRGYQLHEPGQPATPLPPAEFAAGAWTIATSPIMSPGYVRIRPDLLGIRPGFGDGRLYLDVQLPLPQQALKADTAIPYNWRDWQGESAAGDRYRYREEPRFDGRPNLLTHAVLRIPVDETWQLPDQTHTTGDGLTAQAQAAVAALARGVNRDAGPMAAALLGEA